MSSAGNLILAITWILTSLLWFFLENITVGTIWLCAGAFELIIGLMRRNKEKKASKSEFCEVENGTACHCKGI